MTVIQMKSHRIAGNKTFLKLLILYRYSHNDAVMQGIYDFQTYFTFRIRRKVLSASDCMPTVLCADFVQRVAIHLKHFLTVQKFAHMNFQLILNFRLYFCLFHILLYLWILFFHPCQQIFFVRDQIQNTSVFSHILKR